MAIYGPPAKVTPAVVKIVGKPLGNVSTSSGGGTRPTVGQIWPRKGG